MRGRYLFPHCGSMNLDVTCFARNTIRNKGDESAAVTTSLKVFDDGRLVYEKSQFGEIAGNGFKRIRLDNLGFEFDKSKNYLVVLDTFKLKPEDSTYFPQEHQIVYETPKGQRASLLYDQQPAFTRNGKYSPIIVLAPKVLVSRKLNTYIIFAAYREEGDLEAQKEPLTIQLFDVSGKQVMKYSEHIKLNSVYIFDVRKHLEGYNLSDQTQFFNLTAKSGDAVYSIFTIIRNEETGNLAIEHSLPPHYYVSGEKTRIRDEALKIA